MKKWWQFVQKVEAVREAGLSDEKLKEAFATAPVWLPAVQEVIRRLQFDVTEQAVALAEKTPDQAARRLMGLDALRTLEADLMGWQAAARGRTERT